MSNEIDDKKVQKGVVFYEPLYCDPDYLVCENGTIYSTKSHKEMSPAKERKGYLQIQISTKGKSKMIKVHRAVMLTFEPIDNPDEMQVNHIDGVKTNNNRENLEWVTCQENIDHARYVLGKYADNGCRVPIKGYDKFTGELLYEFDSIMEAGLYFANGDRKEARKIAKAISKVKNGTGGYKSLKGCIWR